MITTFTEELKNLVGSAPSIALRSYSVFNVEDLLSYDGLVPRPFAGIAWEGNQKKENSVDSKSSKIASAVYTTAYFSVIIAIDYQYAATEDSKPTATDLLDEIRGIVLGYRGEQRDRPWRWSGEFPLPKEVEGVILYGQTWEKDFIAVGNQP